MYVHLYDLYKTSAKKHGVSEQLRVPNIINEVKLYQKN
jgi:hypothetical protein